MQTHSNTRTLSHSHSYSLPNKGQFLASHTFYMLMSAAHKNETVEIFWGNKIKEGKGKRQEANIHLPNENSAIKMGKTTLDTEIRNTAGFGN